MFVTFEERLVDLTAVENKLATHRLIGAPLSPGCHGFRGLHVDYEAQF